MVYIFNGGVRKRGKINKVFITYNNNYSKRCVSPTLCKPGICLKRKAFQCPDESIERSINSCYINRNLPKTEIERFLGLAETKVLHKVEEKCDF